jgi:hypothetical protein
MIIVHRGVSITMVAQIMLCAYTFMAKICTKDFRNGFQSHKQSADVCGYS